MRNYKSNLRKQRRASVKPSQSMPSQTSDLTLELSQSTAQKPPQISLNPGEQRTWSSDPLIVACIACCSTVCITHQAPPDETHPSLGLKETCTDTFIPTMCSKCDTARGVIYHRATQRLPGGPSFSQSQTPALVNSQMLESWWLYRAVHDQWSVHFDPDEWSGFKVVVRYADFWKSVLKGDKLEVMQVSGLRNGVKSDLGRVHPANITEFFGGFHL